MSIRLNPHRLSPTFSQKRTILSEKRTIFSRKSPIPSQKSPQVGVPPNNPPGKIPCIFLKIRGVATISRLLKNIGLFC